MNYVENGARTKVLTPLCLQSESFWYKAFGIYRSHNIRYDMPLVMHPHCLILITFKDNGIRYRPVCRDTSFAGHSFSRLTLTASSRG